MKKVSYTIIPALFMITMLVSTIILFEHFTIQDYWWFNGGIQFVMVIICIALGIGAFLIPMYIWIEVEFERK